MKTSKELREQKGQLFEQANTIKTTAETEKREMTADEGTKFDGLFAQMKALDKEIERAENFEEEQRKQAARNIAQTQQKREVEQVKSYSFARAIRSKVLGEALDGLEGEMHQEAVKEAREMGIKIGGIGVPQMVLKPESRTILVGTETEIVPTMKQGFIDMLMAKLAIQKLGATFMTGLSGNVSIPRLTAQATAAWKAENATAVESTHTFDSVEMSPKKLTTFTQYSKQTILQSAVGIESLVKNDLIRVSQLALDQAAINGSGSAPEPRGVLNIVGIGSVALGDNGDIPSYEKIVALIKEIEIDNADMGALGFLTNPAVKAKLMATKTDAGSGLFVWPMGAANLAGYNTAITTQVPSNLTKGNGTDLSALIFGNWNDLLIGQWGGLDLLVDPYTQALYDYVRVVVHSYWDIAVRHAQSFAAIKDITTTI